MTRHLDVHLEDGEYQGGRAEYFAKPKSEQAARENLISLFFRLVENNRKMGVGLSDGERGEYQKLIKKYKEEEEKAEADR